MSHDPERSLTALEGAALAVVARHGEATRFMVAKDFAESPSEFWSGSAGAVYPLITRLLARGLLQAVDSQTKRSVKSMIRLTAEGRARMESWLLDADEATQMGYDPLRSRMLNLDLVEADRAEAFLDAVACTVEGGVSPPVNEDDAYQHHTTAVLAWKEARKVFLAEFRRLRAERPFPGPSRYPHPDAPLLDAPLSDTARRARRSRDG
jgi:DNA-binding PadR family transcriptional regulator